MIFPMKHPLMVLLAWTEDGQIVTYDKHDLWMFDPEGKNDPVNITKGYGRKNNVKFGYIKLDPEEQFLSSKMLLSAFDYKTKKAGFYVVDGKSEPELLIWKDKLFNKPKKAKRIGYFSVEKRILH